MSIGRWTNALVSGINETNLSLANFNVDFSLIRVTAPEEYLPLGHAMSVQRRQTAEEGPVHQTARRLGALFSQVAPKTPKLMKAFGQRVSEIMRTPGANPKGSASDGPFRNFVGIDATSIWASATSGPAAISVLLLACMLARKIDDAKASIALWVELISLRQAEIRRYAEVEGHFLDASVLASQQRILRDDIAAFDSSVRSWLSVADQVMFKKWKQLDLILQNLSMPQMHSHSGLQYAKVISAWTNSLTGFEELLEGRPQTITDSSLLLALSAWHLYPNLLVLSSEVKNVLFNDKLMPQQAVVTVGLLPKATDDDSGAFRWSLALSHLKYYGDPVRVDVTDNTRVTIQELELITFGALLSHWEVPPALTLDAASWIFNLAVKLEQPFPRGPPAWFSPLARAAQTYLSARGDDFTDYQALIKCGRRRSHRVLSTSDEQLPPFLGLTNPHLLRSMGLPPGREANIEYLRSMGLAIDLPTRRFVLAYQQTFTSNRTKRKLRANIVATLIPHRRLSGKRDREGTQKHMTVHARWISLINGTFEELCIDYTPDEISDFLGAAKHEEIYIFPFNGSRLVFQLADKYTSETMVWTNAPAFYQDDSPMSHCQPTSTEGGHLQCSCFGNPNWKYSTGLSTEMNRVLQTSSDPWHPFENDIYGWIESGYSRQQILTALSDKGMNPCPSLPQLEEFMRRRDLSAPKSYMEPPLSFVAVRGSVSDVALCVREAHEAPNADIPSKLLIEGIASLSTQTALSSFEAQYLNTDSLKTFIESITTNTQPLELGRAPLCSSIVESLQVLSVSAEILLHCPSATVPMRISNTTLRKAKWFPSEMPISSPVHVLMAYFSRAEAFACICMLELGGTTVDPFYFESVFALSASNSIYVASVLLEDPATATCPWAITRIVGNIGAPGISMIVSPDILKVADAPDDPRAIQHQAYNNRRENSFAGITMHLSMTDWRVPIPTGPFGLIDQDLFLTEAVVSVHDGGKWYADIDVIAAAVEGTPVLKQSCGCKPEEKRLEPNRNLVCIDTIDELLELPEDDAVFRAKGNWAARLAAVCIWSQKRLPAQLCVLENIDGPLCWKCIEERIPRNSSVARITLVVD